MIDPQFGWVLGVAVSLACGGIAALKRSAELGLAVAAIVSMFFPTWVVIDVGGSSLGIRTAVCLAAIGSYAVRFPNRIPSPIILLDVVIACLVLLNIASDLSNGRSLFVAWVAYCEWGIPYVTARYALRDLDATDSLCKCVAGLVIALSIGGIIECLTAVNLWEVVFGDRTGSFSRDASRFGFKRAYGNAIHPIFFAMQLLVLMPLSLSVVGQVRSGVAKMRARGGSGLGVAGIFSALSRGPILGLGATFAIVMAIRMKWMRYALAIALALLGILFAINPVSFFTSAGEFVGEKIRTTILEDEEMATSGSLARLWIYRIYGPALAEAGFLGYGSQAVQSFPVNVPLLPVKARTVRDFQWVDNAYILIGLRFGWLGIAMLILFFVTNVFTATQLASDRAWTAFSIWTGASMIAISLALLTVYLAYDFAFVLLWSAGVLGGISSWSRRALPVR